IRDGPAGYLSPQARPCPGNDPQQVVPAAAQDDPAPLAQLVGEVMDDGRRPGQGSQRDGEMRERVAAGGVAAVLGDTYIGTERAQCGRHDRLETLQPRVIAGARCEGDVDGAAPARAGAPLVLVAGAGKEIVPRLMDRNRQDVRILVEDPLHTVA